MKRHGCLSPLSILCSAAIFLSACGGSGNTSVGSAPPPIPAPPEPPPQAGPAPPEQPPAEPNPPPSSQPEPSTSRPPPEGFIITPENMQPQRSANDDAEYRRNFIAAEMTNALFALDNNWRGQGVLVGVIDNGVVEIGDLTGQINRNLSRSFGGIVEKNTNRVLEPFDPVGDEHSSHGTAVAAIIAGRRDGRGIQGFAPEAQIVSLNTAFVFSDDDERRVGWNISQAIRHADTHRIPLLSMSLGLIRNDDGSPAAASSGIINSTRDYARNTRGLIINSAGNDQKDDPSFVDQLTSENKDSWLFVVAVNPSVTEFSLASYSNRCGAAMNRCVAAVGTHTTMTIDGSIGRFSGTSAAAPQVAGLAATILSKWPQLSGQDAGQIILRTARDLGAPGVDPVFGHGLIDFEAALAPVNPVLSNGLVTSSFDTMAMVLGPAFARSNNYEDKPTGIHATLSQVTVLDEFGRDFTGSIAGLVVQPELPRSRLARRIEAQANAGHAGFSNSRGSVLVGYTAFETGLIEGHAPVLRQQITHGSIEMQLNANTEITAGFNSNYNVLDDVFGMAPPSDAMLAYAPVAQASVGLSRKLWKGKVAVSLFSGEQQDLSSMGVTMQFRQGLSSVKLGVANETGTVFGIPVGSGLMRFGDGARTFFLEGKSGFRKGPWAFEGYTSFGATRLRLSEDMLLDNASTILTSRFGMFARRNIFDGTLTLGVAQDVTAIGGHAEFSLGSRYDLDRRELVFENHRASLIGEIEPQVVFGFEKRETQSSLYLGLASNTSGSDVRAMTSWQRSF